MYNSKSRLNAYKKRAADSKNIHWAGNWRNFTYDNPFKSYMYSTLTRGKNGKIYADNLNSLGYYCGDSEKLARLDHNGWYEDHHYHGLIKGGVIKFRTSKGVYYVPVTHGTNYDGVTLYFNDAEIVARGSNEEAHDDAKRQAARYADRCAEREAENAREEAAKSQAEQDINQARESIHEINKKALQLLKEIKKAGTFSPGICGALKDHLRGLMSTRAAAFETIENLTSNYWLSVEN